jgi:hypothetical protein
MNDILATVDHDHTEFLLQWASLMECLSKRGADERTGLTVSVLAGGSRPPIEATLNAGLELLQSDSAYKRQLARSLLQTAEVRFSDEIHDMSLYIEVLRELLPDKQDVAKHLLRYMLEASSGQALVALVQVGPDFEDMYELLGAPAPRDPDVFKSPALEEIRNSKCRRHGVPRS